MSTINVVERLPFFVYIVRYVNNVFQVVGMKYSNDKTHNYPNEEKHALDTNLIG